MTKISSKWNFRFSGESFNQTDLTHQQINTMASVLGLTTHMNIIMSQITRNSTVCSTVCKANTIADIVCRVNERIVSWGGAWFPILSWHDDVIKWKHFPRYWRFVRGIHQWPVDSPHNGQWRGALKFSLICTWINGPANNPKAGDLSLHRAHYDATVMGIQAAGEWMPETPCARARARAQSKSQQNKN